MIEFDRWKCATSGSVGIVDLDPLQNGFRPSGSILATCTPSYARLIVLLQQDFRFSLVGYECARWNVRNRAIEWGTQGVTPIR
jgi:hypothetical protein